jgi:hypothetical protein
MRNPFDSMKSAKTFANRMLEGLRARGIEMTFPEVLEIVAAGVGVRDWNTLSAGLKAVEPATTASETPAGPAFALDMSDWRLVSAGREDALEEVGEFHLVPWRTEVKAGPGGDCVSIDLIDPHVPIEDEGNRSMTVMIEMDRSVPKVMIAPYGADNLAVIRATPDRLYAEIGMGRVALMDAESVTVTRLDEAEIEKLGDRPEAAAPSP